jgi:NTP pyrophosphatase (non-canonical NTP hydrolase)
MDLEKQAKDWLEERYRDMKFSEYEQTAKETAIYPSTHRILYPALGMAGEAGEVANKVKKIIRDGVDAQPEDWRTQLAGEIGDVLWYCAALAHDINIPLSVIAAQNRDKLLARKEKGTIQGSGDDR